MMKFHSGVVAIALIAGVSQAHAQDGCKVFDELIAVAPSGFESMRGESIGGRIQADIELLGVSNCGITERADRVSLMCVRDFRSEAEARAAYQQSVVEAGMCLAGWHTGIAHLAENDRFRVNSAVRLHQNADTLAGGEFGLALAEVRSLFGKVYRLSPGFMWNREAIS